MNFYIGLDIGGTNIKSGVILENGTILNNNINMYDSFSNSNKDIILNNFLNIILKEIDLAKNYNKLIGIGIGFPGPFDYKNGISKIKNINKYDSIYNINIKQELLNNLLCNNSLKNIFSEKFDILFENDATLYSLGELELNQNLKIGKTLCLCIGTGCGSTFFENGKVLKYGNGIPENGWVYNIPFKDSIIDDFISARGILKFYNSINNENINNVKDIALSFENNIYSRETFNYFGKILAESLNVILNKFDAKNLVLGGQICKSYNLFKDSLLKNLNFSPNTTLSLDTSKSTLLGAKALFN